MTIYLPTGELVGLFNDVVGFACPDPEIPRIHAVRVEYDGECVHAMATDDVHAGISTWHPDDLPEGAGSQEGLFARRGGGDDPWSIVISLTDAVDITKKFKLKDKDAWVPLGLDFMQGVDEHRLRIARNTDAGYPGLSLVVLDRDVEFPNIRAGLDLHAVPRPVAELEFNPILLGHFGAVRMRGDSMKIAFTGEESMAVVRIGERFVGGIRPVRRAARRLSVA